MADATQTNRTGEFLLSEASGTRSRDSGTVVSGQNLLAGTVVGIVTASGKYAAYDNDAVDGTATAVGVLFADCDASAGDQLATFVVRDAELVKDKLVWGSGVTTDGEKTAAYDDLAAVGVIARD